jgi:hypothetical protein
LQLTQVAFARAAAGKAEKLKAPCDYLSGNQVRSRIEAIVEPFTALKGELDRERAAMTRIWAERDNQIDCVIANTARLHGDRRGIFAGDEPGGGTGARTGRRGRAIALASSYASPNSAFADVTGTASAGIPAGGGSKKFRLALPSTRERHAPGVNWPGPYPAP